VNFYNEMLFLFSEYLLCNEIKKFNGMGYSPFIVC